MKKFFFALTFLFAFGANAQTVSRVTGKEVLVNLEGHENLAAGDEIHFLTSELNIAGQGKVSKISAGGKKALVQVVSGKVQAGMTFEKASQKNEKVAQGTSMQRPDAISYTSLSEKERDILQRGEITKGRYVVGGILGTWPLGLGIGHAIQGRYTDKGWIFTVGELGSIAVMASGMGDCWDGDGYRTCNGGAIVLGAVAFVGFKIWEIVDLWAGPPEHNRRYYELKSRLGEDEITFQPAFVPLADGGMLGLRVSF